ncbi:hypothetical protein [Kutzneria sp. CA-103260]|uniref:hypothetical protein n=1 Tax=Kutzneria sp. CA-103260 TaxID=2802641 RepID=UPI001BAD5600|nr:hypothetical protein [Kutzneria sp. CA-103260]
MASDEQQDHRPVPSPPASSDSHTPEASSAADQGREGQFALATDLVVWQHSS